MKELSIEEKAKRYDEAITKARNIVNSINVGLIGKDSFEAVFPELKESEDERMIQYFKDLAPFDKADELYEKYGFSHKDALAWLEKQGEQKPIISNNALREGITHFGITQYQIDNWLKKYVDVEKQGEQESEEFDDTNAKRMFIKALERVEEQNAKGYKLTDCDKNSWWEDFKAYTSCTIEQKPAAWSDEDEKMLVEIVKDLQVCKSRDISRAAKDAYQNEIDWLKSLKDRVRPQSTWKPSKEQMNTLEYYMHTLICNEHKEVLFGLYADLKKLKS